MTCEVIDRTLATRLPGTRERRTDAAARNQRSTSMSTVNEIVAGYIAAWNGTDAGRRRDIIARTWTEDGSYLDSHRDSTGHAAVTGFTDAMPGVG
jgi:hypothetical protein